MKQPKRLSAGIVVLRRERDRYRFLLLRAFNYWDFPKGMVEPGETPLAAAQREVAEETGIKKLEFPWGRDFYETPPYNQGKVARYYLARTGQKRVTLLANPATGRPEHVEYRWLDYRHAARLVSPRVYKVLRWAASRL